MAARKMHGKQMQYKESNDAKIGGDKEGHLGFGGVNGTNRIFALLDKGERVNACKVGDRGQVCGRRNVVDGGGGGGHNWQLPCGETGSAHDK